MSIHPLHPVGLGIPPAIAFRAVLPLSLYIHIPWCVRKCPYCDFNSHEARTAIPEKEYIAALLRDLELALPQIWGRKVRSVFFGGGTPSLLSGAGIAEIMRQLRTLLPLTHDAEITLEANPGTVEAARFEAYRDAGINRLSLGIQSFNDAHLQALGRIHSADETRRAIEIAQRFFDNFNLDLMYGLPQQSLESWTQTLARCLDLTPEHLSCYALTVEEGTRFAYDVRHQRRPAPAESDQIAMDRAAQGILADAGYLHYEISNYAKPGYACRHNLLYWTNGDYLGLGPSAQSFVRGVRFGNVANLGAYQQALAEEQLPILEQQALTEEERLRDAVIFGLRLIQGIPAHQLRRHADNYGRQDALADLTGERLIEEENGRSRLSAQGRLHADTIAERLY